MDRDLASARVLPFSAVVGQDELKLALRMLAVNPRLGGVLIRGEKGTAKSTAARGLAGLLPAVRVNDGCRFACAADRADGWCSECRERGDLAAVERRPPFESLPLGVTEDQLLGALDLERALQRGERRFSPGLLARVNQGVLYVDEVNLLDDHIVDLLLDAAAMGVNVVAREGVAISHPAEFVLVGTMNPEEGDLRPQLLDRFGLCVQVESLDDPEQRADVVERRLEFDANPGAFRQRWAEREGEIADEILRARRLLPQVSLDRSWCVAAAELALSLGVDGHRADVLLVQGAATIAALDGRTDIIDDDLERVAASVLRHRLRRRPFDEAEVSEQELRAKAREVAARAKKKA